MRPVSDHARRRRGVPERLLLPPPPRDRKLAARYAELPFEQRRALASASRRGVPATGTDQERILVHALAEARAATGWRLHVGAVTLGWLVWMTVYGIGRTSLPGPEGRWLLVGLLAGMLVWLPAVVSARRRISRARTATVQGPGSTRPGNRRAGS